MYFDDTGNPFSIGWGRWTVEPIGSSWPVKFSENKQLEAHYEELVSRRPLLNSVPLSHLQIAALAWEIERLFKRDLLEDCWPLLRTMLGQFHELPALEHQQVAHR